MLARSMKRERASDSATCALTMSSKEVNGVGATLPGPASTHVHLPATGKGKGNGAAAVNADIPLDISAVPSVQALIMANNTAKKARHRLRLGEFLNVAFQSVGKSLTPTNGTDAYAANKGKDSSCCAGSIIRVSSVGQYRNDDVGCNRISSGVDTAATRYSHAVHEVMTLLDELVEQHHTLPRSTSLCAVLHAWHEYGLIDDAITLLQRVLRARTQVAPHIFRAAVDERVVTLALRLYRQSAEVTRSDAMQLIHLLPSGSLKRRVFAPLLQYAACKKDVCLVFDVLYRSQKCHIELWDSDYHVILTLLNDMQTGLQSAQNSTHHADESKTIEERVAQTPECDSTVCRIKASSGVELDKDSIRVRTEEVLQVMSQHHPVVGAENAQLVRSLLDGVLTAVDDTGRCAHCGEVLRSFDLSPPDRATLLSDILHNLVEPHISQVVLTRATHKSGSHSCNSPPSSVRRVESDVLGSRTVDRSADACDNANTNIHDKHLDDVQQNVNDEGSIARSSLPEDAKHGVVADTTGTNSTRTTTSDRGDSETEKRLRAEFDEFRARLDSMKYDVVIDGANVGYYGLSSWYREAKEALLRHRGVDPACVTLRERTQVPLPVDVAPRFGLIESMRLAALRQGRHPLIILHARHLREVSSENEIHLQTWQQQRAILASPPFLNDDFCWLYAAIARVGASVLTNDQMRDHHFGLLSPRCFLQWRQRHRMMYKSMYNRTLNTVTLALHIPRPYSVWVQRALAARVMHAVGGKRSTIPERQQLCVYSATTLEDSTKLGSRLGASVSNMSEQSHWHVPYLSTVPVLQQATNHTTASQDDVGLSKDGDDDCSGWVCTYSPA